MNQYLSSYQDLCSRIKGKEANLLDYDFYSFAKIMAEGAKWRLEQNHGGSIITPLEWLSLKAHNFPFQFYGTSNILGIGSLIKFNDLDASPLIEYMDRYEREWKHSNTEEQRIDIFLRVQQDLWDRITDSTCYVWGG